jgi:hypothetical protein
LDAARADALVVLADGVEYTKIDPVRYARTLRRRVVIDGCNALDAERIMAAGLTYRGVGRTHPDAKERPAFA